jgi:N-acetylglucosamine kinase-like BadF-type ATPase
VSRVGHSLDFVAGIDGGGTRTVAVVVDRNGHERGRAIAGSSNYTVVGREQAAAQIRQAVEEATRRAGELPLAAAWIGLSGVDRPGARELLLPLLEPISGEIRLTNDAELIFGALKGQVGVVVIAGTGSIALGRDESGATVRAGGWGHLIGDEGSGYDLGRQALQAAARAADGRGPETTLLDAILRQWHLDGPMAMIGHVYQASEKAEIASLSSLVFAAAGGGDRVAREIMKQAASELALAANAAGDRLNFPNRKVPLALAGGLLTAEGAYREMVVRRVRRRRSLGQVTVVDDPALCAARSLVQSVQADR